MYLNIKCIGKLPGAPNEFERSLVFEIGEFEQPKFDCKIKFKLNILCDFEGQCHIIYFLINASPKS